MDDLEALIRAHRAGPSPKRDERLLQTIASMMDEMTQAIIAELRGTARPGTMIRYRPDVDRGARSATMIRYRPDVDRGARPGAMIRYRPDTDRDARPGAMIRYRPDWDRDPRLAEGGQPSPGVRSADPHSAASAFLEPMLKNLAERLGPEDAHKVVIETLNSMGLIRTTTERTPEKGKPLSKEPSTEATED